MMRPLYYLFIIATLSGVAMYFLWSVHAVDPSAARVGAEPTTNSVASTRPAPAVTNTASGPKQHDQPIAVPTQEDPLATLKRRLDDPREHEANLRRAILNIEQRYGRLFQRLKDFPPDVLDKLKLALAEDQLAMERGALPDHMPVDDAERKLVKENMDRIQKNGDEQVQALLGDDGYAQYDLFRKSEPYRESIEQVTNLMRARGVTVNEDLQGKILNGYTKALIEAAAISSMDVSPAAFQALSDSARQELRAKQQSRFDEKLAMTMSTILSPAEYKLFMESQFAQDGNGR